MSGVVSLEFDGRLYEAEYHLVDGVVTVYGDEGSEFTSLGGAEPEAIAKQLLRRLAQRGEIEPLTP